MLYDVREPQIMFTPTVSNPPEDPAAARRLQLARERRDQLLAQEQWIDASTVHAQQGGNPNAQGSQ